MQDSIDAKESLNQVLGQLRARVAMLENAHSEQTRFASVLQSENQLISAALDATDSLIVVFDADGRLVRMNRACERLTGYSIAELQSKHVCETLLPPEGITRAMEEFARIQAEESTWIDIGTGRHVVAWSYSLVRGQNGEVEYVIGTGKEVSKQSEPEEAIKLDEMRLNSLLELSQRSSELSEREIIQLTLEEVVRLTQSEIGYLHFVNPDQETIRLYTWSKETLKYCTAAYEAHYPISKAGVWADCARLKKPVVHNDYQNLPNRKGYPEGHSHLVRHASIPIMDGDNVAIILGVGNKRRDYTQADVRQLLLAADSLWKLLRRKRAEEQLREHVRALQEADRQKDGFLAMLAHELRNPLAPIDSALLVLSMPDADAKALDNARKAIRRQLDHITRLVDDLLDVSRITKGKIELKRESVDLVEVIRHAVDTTSTQIDDRRHKLVVQLARQPVQIDGDVVRLGQIASNLLNNAAKYTPPGGKISVTVEAEDGDAVLRVCDTGVGISAEMLPRVFDQFAQADQALDRSQGGLGLGLTLVQKLAHLHGGTVNAHSDGLGRGSEFVLRLPLAHDTTVSGRHPDRAPVATEPESRRILIVDDNLDPANMLTTLLDSMGHRVHAVNDGTSALEAVRWFGPQVILLDIGLPGMDGYEVAKRIREEHRREEMLLIALTGYGHEQALQRSREAGFDHHLVKPLHLPSLLELLASAPR